MKVILLLIPAMFFILSGCNQSDYTIEPEEAKDRLENDETIVLLDVRTLEEYNDEHITGAELLPLTELESKMPSMYPDKTKTYFVYCRTGSRSADAIEILSDLGYEDIHDLGGIVDWPYDKAE